MQKGGKKTKALHPLASKRIFLLCETGREKSLRFFLLCLIDINMKYSSVVLIRLGFPARVRGKLFWIRIFLAKIFCLNPPCTPPPSFPALASKAQQCVLGCCTHTPQPPPLHGRQAGRLASQECRARKLFFPEAASGSLAGTQAVVLAAGLAGGCRV